MKNLFDYATKELSQDAFLRWFLESWDDPDIGMHSVHFIEKISGLSNLNGRIAKLQTQAQVDHIDISCDFWVGDEQHLLIIEDKVNSTDHGDQLNRYTEKIKKWENASHQKHSNVHLLYYKTSYLDDSEKSRVENATGIEGKKWLIWNLEEVDRFFSAIGTDTKSTILNQYVEHVGKIKHDLDNVSSLPIKEWSFRNWEGYFRKVLQEKIRETFADRYEKPYDGRTYFWNYQGRYVSINHYIDPCTVPTKPVRYHTKLDLEIFLRPWQDEITATIHPAVSDEKDENEKWKCHNVFTEKLREIARDEGGPYFVSLRTKQCIGKFGKKSKMMSRKSAMKSVDQLTAYILDLLVSFHNVFEGRVTLGEDITEYEQVAVTKNKEDEED